MAIAFLCEQCGKRFEVADALAGKRGRCKQCGHSFVIPAAREPAAPEGAGAAAAAFDPYEVYGAPATPPREEPQAIDPDQFGVSEKGKSRKNPYLTIWTKPRATIRRIVKNGPDASQTVLLLLASNAAQAIIRASSGNMGDKLSGGGLIMTVGLASVVTTLLNWFVAAPLFRVAGGMVGGQGETDDVRAAMAWAGVPTIATLAFWLPLLLVFGRGFLENDAADDVGAGKALMLMVAGVATIVLAVWSFVLLLKCLGEVLGLSAFGAFGALFLAVLLIVLVIAALVIAGMVAFSALRKA